MDPIPLLSLLLKPLSPLLPTPFQYLGIAAVLAVSLQFFFAARLFRLLLGRNVFGVLLPSLFFLIAPPMTWRLAGHYALANHWLLVAALCLFVSLQKAAGDKMRKLVLLCGLLGGVAVGINAYLAFMVLVVLSAGVVTACWRHRLGLKTACGIFAATGIACLISALALGLVRSDGGYAGGGYREYSMNLLAPIDPGTFGALFLRSMPHFSTYQYEGYNYLGAGVLMLAVMLLPSLSRSRVRRLTAAEVVPLAVGCLALTALAVSTKVTAGSVLVADLDPHETLTRYLAVFRGSGRLFWVPYYVILTAILATGVHPLAAEEGGGPDHCGASRAICGHPSAAEGGSGASKPISSATLPLAAMVIARSSACQSSRGSSLAVLAAAAVPILPEDRTVFVSLDCWPCPSTCARTVIMRRVIRPPASPSIAIRP